MSTSPPMSIVVIHGVGDHKQEDTARAFSRAMAQTMSPELDWALPSLVTRTGDVQAETGEGPLPQGFTFSAYKVSVPWPKKRWVIPLYEFYWSDLTRHNLGLLGEIHKIWHFVVGPPRVGFQALTVPVQGMAWFVLACLRLIYVTVWFVAIARMLTSLILFFAMQVPNSDFLRYYEIIFPIDATMYAILLFFSSARCATGVLPSKSVPRLIDRRARAGRYDNSDAGRSPVTH